MDQHQPRNRKPLYIRAGLNAIVLIFSLIFSSLGVNALSSGANDETNPQTVSKLMIYEVKQGANKTEGEPVEYVTIYNPTDSDISILNWTVEYARPGFNADRCTAAKWLDSSSGSLVEQTVISGVGKAGDYPTTIKAHGLSVQIPLPINDSAAGSVHLTDTNGTVNDLVGWQYKSSTKTVLPPCAESNPTASLSSSKSLQRFIGCLGEPVDSDDNASDMFIADSAAGKQLGNTVLPTCQPLPSIPQSDTPTDTPQSSPPAGISTTCEGVLITEILPNPAGPDSENEFIELYNPTDEIISMDKCALQYADQGATSHKDFNFNGQVQLQPGQYLAFGNKQTGLTLTNSKAGSIWLLTNIDPTKPTEISEATYPADLGDDISWMRNNDASWAQTYTPTPNAANVLTTAQPCPEGQTRNPDTDRCVNITSDTLSSPGPTSTGTSSSTLAPCAANQTRNPETNRCRSTATTTATTTACKPGQERNPETNRCKTAVSTAATDKSCPAGQERNPETNRCRKSVAGNGSGGGMTNVKDIASQTKPNSKNYGLIATIALAAAVAYGIYEWRQEIIGFIRRRLSRKVLPSVPMAAAKGVGV